jgi:hypothetical protein
VAASASAIADASASPSAEALAPAQLAWSGTYASTAGVLYVPPELKVSWKPTATTTGVGDGALSLRVDRATGQVRGEVDGPLGPATLAGFADSGKITATISRKDPSDHGFAGTMVGTLGPDRGEGTMNLSLAEGGAIRTATFVLSSGRRSQGPSR